MLRLIGLALVSGCAAPGADETGTIWLPAHTTAPNDDAISFSRSEILILRTMWPLPQVPEDPTNWVADDPWDLSP